MKKLKVTAILLALAIIFTGCSMIEVNEEVDRQTVVAKVGDEVVLKGDVLDQVDYMIQMYAMYGYYPEDFATNAEYKEDYELLVEDFLNAAVASKVELIKARENGCYEFTDEERAEMDEGIHSVLNSHLSAFAQELILDPEFAEMTEDELAVYTVDHIDEYFAQIGSDMTMQSITDDFEDTKALELLKELATKDVVVTEDEVTAEYNQRVEDTKAGYESGSASYEQDINYGSDVYYVPSEARQIQHILIAVPEEYQTEIDALKTEGDTEGAQKMLEEALAEIKAKADEAYARAATGEEEFELLMLEFGEDPGMESNDYYTLLNPSSLYAEEFVEGAFALDKVGDISEPVASDFGYHIIKFYGSVESGAVPLEDVYDAIYEEILNERVSTTYDEQVTAWKEEIDIKTYLNKLLS